MTTENLAIVFGPLLLRLDLSFLLILSIGNTDNSALRSSDPDFDKIFKETAVINEVVNYLIQQYCQLAVDE